MILFSFSLFNPVLDYCYKYDLSLNFRLTDTRNSSKKFFNLIYLKYNKPFNLVALNKQFIVNQLNQKFFKTNQSKSIIKRNFWQKLINKYWQETIFISSSNSILENYSNKLKSSGFSVYEGNDYKHFLVQFSKDLLDRKICISSDNLNYNNISNLVTKKNFYVKYKWLKFYNPKILLLKFQSSRFDNKNLYNLSDKSLPIFVLINSNKQLVLAESSDQLCTRQMFLKFYNKLTHRSLIAKKLYTGLFFVNPHDAMEYQNYINTRYSNSTRNIKVKIVATTLDFYFNTLITSKNQIEFRLVPDLKEINNFIYRYRKYKNLVFDSSQKHGYNYFQGQPIYVIKPIQLRVNKNSKKLQYFFSFLKEENNNRKYSTVFLNYQTAFNAWQAYKEVLNCNLPTSPNLYVSNLETFVQTSNYIKNQDRFIFLPSLESFNFTKKYLKNNLSNSNNVSQSLQKQCLFLKGLLYRALWSLTTRQPNIW
uniref:Ycf80 n=1 Tax=Chondria tumulosa TaxID=2740715 RepID=A0A896SSZ3_9FLOR|nr:hypothetical protein K8K75_pgp134 [Chondria tumulosa]QSD57073.1 hypothetical protein [Chondria tumulosa]